MKSPQGMSQPYQSDGKTIRVIDHNLAFDTEFTVSGFFDSHIFTDYKNQFNDVEFRCAMASKSDLALSRLHTHIASIPAEWHSIDLAQTIPADIDYAALEATQNRMKQNEFWRLI
jgi:hypothetical protein